MLSFVLVMFLVQARRQLAFVVSKNRKYSSVQKVFSKAVSGMEANLEQEKQVSTQLFRALESINDGVAIIDREGLLRFANASLWRLYAIPYEDIDQYMGKPWFKLHSPKGQKEISTIVMPELERKGVWLGETDVLVADGSLIRAELYISRNEEGSVGFIRDVTDRHRAEIAHDKLRAQVHELQKSEAVERVVRAMIHEFNNSLSSISGFAEMLIEDLPAGFPQQEFATKIYYASQQMQGLVEQTRLLIPGAKQDFVQETDILSVLPIVIGELKKKMTIDFDIEKDIHVTEAKVKCDAFRVGQMLLHILQNAIEAGAHEKIRLEIDVYRHGFNTIVPTKEKVFYQIEKSDSDCVDLHFGCYDPKMNYLQITVKDHGKGILYGVMEHILDPFFSTKKQNARTGLGMSIVKSVIRHCEGYLMINSTPDKGTVVTIILPTSSVPLSDSRSTKAIIQRLVQEMT